MRNLSDSKIYKEKQMRQKRQKTASFFKKTKESEATIHLKWKQQSQNMSWHENYTEETLTNSD